MRSQVRVLLFVLLTLWKTILGLSILWVYSILEDFFFFPHMQGSKTSVFIKDILFFRLEKITKKKRTNKSLQRKKRPTMYSPWVAILNWFRVLSTAGSLRAGSLPPTQAVHHSLHTQPIHGLILHQLCFIYRSICRVLSSLWNPSAGCSILYYFDALIFLLS